MWAAHLLTISRVPLAALFWVVADEPRWAMAVLAVAALTDVADGWVARRARRRLGLPDDAPSAGAWLDPLCDKLLVVSVLGATWLRLRPPLLLLLAIAARELVLVPLAVVYRLWPGLRARLRYDFRAGPIGKAATLCQVLTILAILARHPVSVPLAWITAAVGLAAAAHYLRTRRRRDPSR